MKFKIYYTIIVLTAICALPLTALHPENNYSGFTWTITGGPSYINGYYDEYIDPGFSVRFSTYYNYPVIIGNTYFKGGAALYDYNFGSGDESSMRQADMIIGTGIFYTIFSYVDLIAGIDFHGSYSNLRTANTDRNEYTFKPGYSFSFGAMTYLGRGIGVCLLSDYRNMSLSGKNFSTIDFTAGFTYNYMAYVSEIDRSSKSEKKLNMFNQGLAEFKKKNFSDARSLLRELYAIDKNYPGLDYYIKRIEEIEQSQATADALIEQQNYLKAIPYLEGCSAYIKDCELKLLSQRKNLKVNVQDWVNEGIRLYDEKNYKACIEIMEKILLVDPENQDAGIYLPRAIKRQKAIESLQGR